MKLRTKHQKGKGNEAKESTAEPVRAISLARGVESSMADGTDIARRGAVHIVDQNLPICQSVYRNLIGKKYVTHTSKFKPQARFLDVLQTADFLVLTDEVISLFFFFFLIAKIT